MARKTDTAHQFLTLQATAQMLSADESTVRRRIRRGELPAYRMGKSHAIRIREADVLAMMKPIVNGKQA